MFVRVKSTPNSPRKSVQIVQSVRKGTKVSQKIVRHIGIAIDEDELTKLKYLAEEIKLKIESHEQPFLFTPEEMIHLNSKKQVINVKEEDYQVNIQELKEEQRNIVGIHEIYGKLFNDLSLHSIFPNPERKRKMISIFKNIVLARIANPKSKRSTINLLEENFGITLNLDKVYRMMDQLDDQSIEDLNQLIFKNSKSLCGGKIDVVFFDCTTLYFESFKEDEFKRNGYSKDLKFNQPQVLLALMVTKEGLPLGYKAFSGNTYEGHTLIPCLKELRKNYNLDKVVYVADAGMLNKNNLLELESLENSSFEYIVGARLKSFSKELQSEILNPKNYKEISKDYKIARFDYKGRSLVVSYSKSRAKKDACDREKAISKLKDRLSKIKSPKNYLSNYGYKKYLKVTGKSSFELDEEKIAKDCLWDGLHGMVTNSKTLSDLEIIQQYKNLWEVENAFRITKHDLKVRPIFHWKPRRVKAHIAISFVAYALVKHLNYRVKLQYKPLSPEKIRQLLINVQQSILYSEKKKIRYAVPSKLSLDIKKIYKVMGLTKSDVPFIIQKL